MKLNANKNVSARALLACGAFLAGMLGLPAHAAFTYTGGDLTTSQTYDGLGVDSANNPLTIGSRTPTATGHIGTSAGSGVLTVLSGTLTMNCDDFKVSNQAGANTGTVNVGTGATFNLNLVGRYSVAFGQQSGGSMTISNGATMNVFVSGTNEQRFAVGNSGTCTSTLTLLGGTLNVNLDPARTLSDAQRSFCVGVGSTCPGTINLMSGTLNDNMPLPFALGGQYGGMTTAPVFNQASASNFTISNGVFVMTNICATTDNAKATFSVASGSYVNFLTGGTGQLSLVNYQLSDYSNLVSAGRIQINGASAVIGQFAYSMAGNQGRLNLPPPGTPFFTAQPTNVTVYAGSTVQFSAMVDGTPAPTCQWMRGPVGGPYTNLVNSGNISGATNLTLTITNTAVADSSEFVLLATNINGSAQSSPVDLVVNPLPSGGAINLVDNSGVTAFTGSSTSLLLATNLTVSASANTLVVVITFRNNSGNLTEAPSTLNWTNSTVTNVLELAGVVYSGASGAHGRNVAIYYTTNPASGFGFNTSGQLSGQAGSSGLMLACTLSGVDTTVAPVFNSFGSSASGPGAISFTQSVGIANSWAAVGAAIAASGITTAITVTNNGAATGTPVLTTSSAGFSVASTASLGYMANIAAGSDLFTYTMSANTAGNQSIAAAIFSPPVTIPVVTSQPQPASAYPGQTASFSVTARGGSPNSYFWRTNGVIIGADGGSFSGSTSTTLNINPVVNGLPANYDVVITNSYGSVTSSVAGLTVLLLPPSSGAYSSNVLALNPVAYWPLNDNAVDPYRNGGAPLYDAAGMHDGMYLAQSWNGNDGILGLQPADGCPLFCVGQGTLETIANLDQSWAIVPALNLNTNSVTITMWVKPLGQQPDATGLFFDGNTGNNSGMCYAGPNQRLGYVWNDEQGTMSYTNGPVIPTNIWSFIAVVISPSSASFYVINTCGVSSSTNTYNHVVVPWSGGAGPDPLCRIGCARMVSNTFNGLIDEVAVYNYDLTPSQIQNMTGLTFGNMGSGNTMPTNLVMATVSNNAVSLSWPLNYTGWILQVQTNSLAVGNWVDVSGATTTNQMVFPVNTGNSCAFYRLVNPNPGSSIDRYALVERHNIQWNTVTGQIPLGNGEFCFNADGTGLQTFGGNSMSHWGWHSFPLPAGVTAAQIPPTGTFEQGHVNGPDNPPPGTSAIETWMTENPHIMNLGRMRLCKADGTVLGTGDISGLTRTLDLWSGTQTANYQVDGVAVSVETCVNPTLDAVVVQIDSPLIASGGLQVILDFPYPSLTQNQPWVGDFSQASGESNATTMTVSGLNANFARVVDSMTYNVSLALSAGGNVVADTQTAPNTYLVSASGTNSLEFTCAFSSAPVSQALPTVEASFQATSNYWQNFWSTGGAIDLSGSTNTNWFELERRIVLSQYELAIQDAGSWEEAEGGLTGIDPWVGQFHMEMLWWHLAHYALWDRWSMAEGPLACYQAFMPVARELAAQLDYAGLKWGKEVAPEGRTAPWVDNQVLLWKEPHPMFFAELDYRLHPTQATLEKWYPIIYGTAEHMADYPTLDPTTGIYSLAFDMPPSEDAIWSNTVFDLAYWRWGLNQAQVWRQRLGLARLPQWDQVLTNLAPLPVANGVFVDYAGYTGTYTTSASSHPDPIGVYGMLPPTQGVDPVIAQSTVLELWSTWNWNSTWGWDCPWTAMAAARTGEPQIAIDSLLNNTSDNQFDQRGINTGGPCPYLPGNGGLLYAVAMMAAGWDGCPARPAPGFPADGNWTVKWEGLKKAP